MKLFRFNRFYVTVFLLVLSLSQVQGKSTNQNKQQMKAAVVGKTFIVGTRGGLNPRVLYLAQNGRAYVVGSRFKQRIIRSYWSVRFFSKTGKLAICTGETKQIYCGSVAYFKRAKIADHDKYNLAGGKLDKSLFPKNFFYKYKKK